MAARGIWFAAALLCSLVLHVFCQDFDLSDAFDDVTPKPATPKPKPKPGSTGRGEPGKGFDLSDFFDKTTTKVPVTPKPKPNPDFFEKTTAKVPVKPKPKPQPAGDGGLDLSDALDPQNDIRNDRNKKGGGEFSDADLFEIGNDDSYSPDKGKGGRGSATDTAGNAGYENTAETGTIAGIASAVVMALMGAVGSYVSYQKKKFCFGVQQSLNAEYVKAEGPHSVVFQEPPVQQTLLHPPNAEPPSRM